MPLRPLRILSERFYGLIWEKTPAKLKRRTGENMGVYDEMARTGIERETIICYNEAEKTANVYTFNAPLIRRLEKYADERPNECKLIKTGPDGSVEYEVPKKWCKVKPPMTKNLTDEQRQVASERMKQLRRDSKL